MAGEDHHGRLAVAGERDAHAFDAVLAHQALGVALLGGARRPEIGALLGSPGERRLIIRWAGRPGIRRAGGGEDGESDHNRSACPKGNRAEVHWFAYLV